MSKKLFIETLGCAMNSRDSEHMIAQLKEKEGYETTDDFRDADLILINTTGYHLLFPVYAMPYTIQRHMFIWK